MMNVADRKRLEHFLRAMELAYAQNDYATYVQALDDFNTLGSKLEDQLKPAPEPKVRFHPAHQKATQAHKAKKGKGVDMNAHRPIPAAEE